MNTTQFRLPALLLALCLLVGAGSLSAATLKASNIAGPTGGTAVVKLSLTASPSEAVAGVQVNVTLSNANATYVSVATGASATAASKGAAGTLNGNVLTIIVFGLNTNVIANGVVAEILYNISPTAAVNATTTVALSACTMTDSSAANVANITLTNGEIAVAEFDDRDTNRDGKFNIVDIQLTVNIILQVTAPLFPGQGDSNGDGIINVLDTQESVLRVLSPPVNTAPTATNLVVTGGAGVLGISFTATDGESNVCAAFFEYSLNNGTSWVTAKKVTNATQNLLILPTSGAGINYTASWSTAVVLGGEGIATAAANTTMKFRVTVSDNFNGNSGNAVSTTFTLDNSPQLGAGTNLVINSFTTGAGTTFTVPVKLVNAANKPVAGADFKVTFNTNHLTFVSAATGAAATAAGKSSTANSGVAGQLSIICFGLNTTAIADGEIVVLTFTVKPSITGVATTIDMPVADLTMTSPTATDVSPKATVGGTVVIE